MIDERSETTTYSFEDIFVGLAGLELDFDNVDLGEDVSLGKTYAHLMSPFLMAFKPQAKGLWKAAQGGFEFDIVAELFIPKNLRSKLQDRINTAKLIVALMRLSTTPTIILPVMSNISFTLAENAPDNETCFLPFEVERKYFSIDTSAGKLITEKWLEWVKKHWVKAEKLIDKHIELKFALDALDRGQFINNKALTIVSLWAGLESLFSPSTAELRFRNSALIASYLHEPGMERQKLYKKIMKLYNARSSAAHGQPKFDQDELLQTFVLLKDVIRKMITDNHVPSKEELEDNLFGDCKDAEELDPK